MLRRRSGQSVLEYTLLIAIVVAALLIMQVFVKRGFQGNLKESADKMGDQFSGGGTATEQKRTLTGDQVIRDEVATTGTINAFPTAGVSAAVGTIDKGALSLNQRTGGQVASDTKSATDAATQEKTRWSEYQTDQVTEFAEPF